MANEDRTAPANADAQQTWVPEDVRYRVLLAVPDIRTIPIFSLDVEAQRPDTETEVVSSSEALPRLVSGNLARTIQARYTDHHVIHVRRRLTQRTVIYSSWLAFPTMALAEAFVNEQARLGLNGIEKNTRAEYASGRELLDQALRKGRYDLSRYEPLVRHSRAAEYIEKAESVANLESSLRSLSRLRKSLEVMPEGVSVG